MADSGTAVLLNSPALWLERQRLTPQVLDSSGEGLNAASGSATSTLQKSAPRCVFASQA